VAPFGRLDVGDRLPRETADGVDEDIDASEGLERLVHESARLAIVRHVGAAHEGLAARVTRFGLSVVRGSSSRGGTEALRALAAAVRAGQDVAVVPDGPRGPRECLQAGLVVLAAATGAPVVPLAFAARPARRLASWDRFLVPLPFARAAGVCGAAARVPRGADREQARVDLERALREVTETADRLVGA
jgi:lysophospholipid acyltransferase (LPLAT)-like uncharacterized protein